MSSTDMALGNLRNVENGNIKMESKETNRHGKTAHNMSSSSLRKKSDLSLVSKVKFSPLRKFLANIQEVILGTKLSILFSAIPLAIIADTSDFGRPWVFAFSLLGLIPLAERVSFLTEQTAYYTGEAVGGLLNATCGNATEIIISLFALYGGKIDVLKYTLLGSILSNLLLVLGTALLCGGLAYLRKDQKFDKRQGDVNCSLLLLGLLCHLLSLLLKYGNSNSVTAISVLQFSRVGSIFMLFIYFVYLIFQLKTHRQLFESQEDDDEEAAGEEKAVIGFISAVIWLVGMTIIIALLSEYVVATIEEASKSWGMSVSFLSIILLPIVGNAAEHAGAIIFAFKDKLDISLGVALGSATQISMFAVPLIVVVAWGMGIPMDLDFNILETASLLLAILTTAYVLQDGTSHYLKGVVLLLCYLVIASCFFLLKTPPLNSNVSDKSMSRWDIQSPPSGSSDI